MAVELKNISALRNGVDNPSFDTTGVSYLTRLYNVYTHVFMCVYILTCVCMHVGVLMS